MVDERELEMRCTDLANYEVAAHSEAWRDTRWRSGLRAPLRLAPFGLLILAATGCRDRARDDRKAQTATASASSALVMPGKTSASATAPAQTIEFIEDDYPRARELARATHRPIFADTWATWCHTCMSMRQYVFPAPEMQALASRFVWLSIDSEKAENAAFLEHFPATALPTLWVIDATDERPRLKWIGAATAVELAGILDDAANSPSDDGGLGEAAAAATLGDRATAAGQANEAITAYQDALKHAPMQWKRRPRVVEALSLQLLDLEKRSECIELALAEMPTLPAGTSRANVVGNALSAAADLPEDSPLKAKVPLLIAEGTRIAENANEPVLIDDRSGLFLGLVGALHNANPVEAKRLARSWATMLERAAKEAPTAEKRAVWDPHRLEAYMELGEVEKAIPMLEQSERDFPRDFNPPARLGRAYYELKRYEPALVSITRALDLAEGPRRLRYFMLKADILVAQNDRSGARKAIGDALAFASKLQLPPNYRRLRQTLEKRYADLG